MPLRGSRGETSPPSGRRVAEVDGRLGAVRKISPTPWRWPGRFWHDNHGGLSWRADGPAFLAGGGGTLTPGRYVEHGSKPLTNLDLSMADHLGIRDLRSFGGSAGPVGNLCAMDAIVPGEGTRATRSGYRELTSSAIAVRRALAAAIFIHGVLAGAAFAHRQMEALGRGVVAIPAGRRQGVRGMAPAGDRSRRHRLQRLPLDRRRSAREIEPRAARNATNFVDSGANSQGSPLLFRPAGAGRPGRRGPARRSAFRPTPRRGPTSRSRSRPSPAIPRTTPRSATSTATASTRSS